MKKLITKNCIVFILISCLSFFMSCQKESSENHPVVKSSSDLTELEKNKYEPAVIVYDPQKGMDISDLIKTIKEGHSPNNTISVNMSLVHGTGMLSIQGEQIIINDLPTVWSQDDLSSSDIPNNMDVVTLEFQHNNKKTTLDVLVVLSKQTDSPRLRFFQNEDQKTNIDTRATSYDYSQTYLGIGYDVINSGGITMDGLKRTNPVLDINKLNAASVIIQKAETGSNWRMETSLRIDSLYSKLYVNAGASVSYGIFSASASVEYKTEKDGYQTNAFSKAIGLHTVKDEWVLGAQPSTLRNYLSEDFVNMVNTATAAKIIDTYGTHVFVRCFHGGIAEINTSYYGSKLKTVAEIHSALNANITAVSVYGTLDKVNNSVELRNNSYVYATARGGNQLISFTDWETFISKYPTWVSGIQSNPTLCGISNFDDCFVSIWDLAASINSAKSLQIKAEFTQRLLLQQKKLSELQRYVTNINVWAFDKSSDPIPAPYIPVYNGMYVSNGIILDANEQASGKWIRIGYVKTGTTPIEDIIVIRYEKHVVPTGYIKIDVDLNKGAGGNYLYLAYKPVDSKSTQAISYIGASSTKNAISSEILSDLGWSWVKYDDFTSIADLNKEAKGNWIHLTVKKVPYRK